MATFFSMLKIGFVLYFGVVIEIYIFHRRCNSYCNFSHQSHNTIISIILVS
jgi:hypothetical protein